MQAKRSIGTALERASHLLGDRREAFALLGAVLSLPEARLIGWPETFLTEEENIRFESWLTRRLAGEPLAYLLGEKEFWSLLLHVNSATLIPRPETELLVETILEKKQKETIAVLDLCTGSGAIALALASERPAWKIIATDQSEKALAVARANAERLKLPVQFFLGDLFEASPVGESYDLIVSNPPYLSGEEWDQAAALHYEPRTAFVACEAGLALIRRIFEKAPAFLKAGGALCIEHGYQQGPAVAALARSLGYTQVETRIDALGHPRLCWAQC